MSIRLRLVILVAILAAITLTLLGYLVTAFADTRQRFAEADAALREFERAANTGASIARLRLELLHYLASGGAAHRSRLDGHIRACTGTFELWVASSQSSLEVGIENEAGDLDAIVTLYAEFEKELADARGLVASQAAETEGAIKTKSPARSYTFFEGLLESDIPRITEDDVKELGDALDGVLLSMGTTPWIARIGPAQLASARATLAELRSLEEVRNRLLRQATQLASFLAGGEADGERRILDARNNLEQALGAWGRATEAYTETTGDSAPPFYADFAEQNPHFQQHVDEALNLARRGRIDESRAFAGSQLNLALEEDLLAAVDSSLAVEVEELREMLGRLATSTGVAGAGGIVLMCAILLSTLILFLTTARTMLRSLEQLRAGTERIGAGDFDYRLNLTTSDELGRLAANFDTMAEKLLEQVRRRKSLEEELLRNERLATLGQVIATVSHEIRNPLGTLQTSIYSLRKRVGDQGEAVAKSLDRAERSIVRCDRIIGELLEYTRTREPVCVETPLDAWLAEVLDDFNLPAGIAVTRKLDSGALVAIDRDRLQGCVVNLLSNACQSMVERPGGPERCELLVESRCDAGHVQIRITDTGPGIPPEVLARVFEPMFSTRTFGVGLGLPIVKKSMEQHDGGVELASQVGCGTSATLWLPLVQRKEKQDEEAPNTGG